jgi:NAD(P)-dependent dehydrogenase (short-subunit alcohol dehydrogenase family)
MPVWFITGAARGFGLELAASALAHGDRVVATARNRRAVLDALPAASDSLLVAQLDVTDQEQATMAVQAGVERFGRIDVVVNNAGYGLFGAVEEISDTETRTLFDTNVFGLLSVTRAALPTLRAQRSGRIINMGSSAGFAAGAGRGIYGASKFAVEAITEALRAELAPLGIHVTIVEPGSFRTQFLTGQSRRQAQSRVPAYADTTGLLHAAVEVNDGHQPRDPVKAVPAIRDLATSVNPPLRLQLGSDCVTLVEGKMASVASELDRWRDLALSTDFPPA